MSDERDLLRAMRADPDDRATRMVYADALEQRGQHVMAEMTRLQETFDPEVTDEPREKRLRVLANRVPAEWRAETARRAIDGCNAIELKFQCPKRWEALASRADTDPDVRFCNSCDREVYFCTSLDEVRLHGEAKQCVAFDSSLIRDKARHEYEMASVEIMMGEVYDEPPLVLTDK